MSSKRLEQIQKARSLNDVLTVLSDIEFELKNSQAVVGKLISSFSAEISFDTRSKRPRTVEKFVAPKVAELKKHTDVINKLYNNVVELDAAEAMVKQAFAGNKKQPAALNAIAALKSEVDNSLNDAFDALQEIANKHLPKAMTRFVDDITAHLLNVLNPKSFKDITHQVFVTFDEENKALLHFSQYIGVESLKTTSGFTFDQYYFVVTGVMDTKTSSITYYLNSFPDFKVPGKYPLGREVSTLKDAQSRVDLLLAHNDFLVISDKLALPFDGSRVKNSGLHTIKGVEKTEVLNDEVVVYVADTVRTDSMTQNIILEVMARLNSIVGAGSSKTLFTYKSTTSKGRRVIKFILTPRVGKIDKHVNLEKLEEAAVILNLTPTQKKALRFALQH